jgi:transposase
MGYSTDLTDVEWEIIEPLLPKKKITRPILWSKRQNLNGIFYQLKNGCNWCDLPKDLPPYSTVFWHYKQWRSEGIIAQIRNKLHQQVRLLQQKNAQWTTLMLIDSQAVKDFVFTRQPMVYSSKLKAQSSKLKAQSSKLKARIVFSFPLLALSLLRGI